MMIYCDNQNVMMLITIFNFMLALNILIFNIIMFESKLSLIMSF